MGKPEVPLNLVPYCKASVLILLCRRVSGMHVLCWIKYCCMLFMASMARVLGVASFSLGLAQCVGARGSALGRLLLIIELEVYDDTTLITDASVTAERLLLLLLSIQNKD